MSTIEKEDYAGDTEKELKNLIKSENKIDISKAKMKWATTNEAGELNRSSYKSPLDIYKQTQNEIIQKLSSATTYDEIINIKAELEEVKDLLSTSEISLMTAIEKEISEKLQNILINNITFPLHNSNHYLTNNQILEIIQKQEDKNYNITEFINDFVLYKEEVERRISPETNEKLKTEILEEGFTQDTDLGNSLLEIINSKNESIITTKISNNKVIITIENIKEKVEKIEDIIKRENEMLDASKELEEATRKTEKQNKKGNFFSSIASAVTQTKPTITAESIQEGNIATEKIIQKLTKIKNSLLMISTIEYKIPENVSAELSKIENNDIETIISTLKNNIEKEKKIIKKAKELLG